MRAPVAVIAKAVAMTTFLIWSNIFVPTTGTNMGTFTAPGMCSFLKSFGVRMSTKTAPLSARAFACSQYTLSGSPRRLGYPGLTRCCAEPARPSKCEPPQCRYSSGQHPPTLSEAQAKSANEPHLLVSDAQEPLVGRHTGAAWSDLRPHHVVTASPRLHFWHLGPHIGTDPLVLDPPLQQ